MAKNVRVAWNGDALAGRARRGADQGAEAGADHVRDVAARRAPRLTGALRASARVVREPKTGTAAVTFDADYAVYQHEDLDYRHDDGGPKFLETALVSERRAVARLMQAEVREAFGT
ncbi:hypothetical protein [Actinophytocola sediminis]